MLYELIGVVRISLLFFYPLLATRLTLLTGPPRQPSRSPRVRLPFLFHHPHIPALLTPFPRIAKTTGNIVLNAGGVVRGITNWGVFHLPKPMRKNTVTHNTGHYFVVRFDSSARTQHAVRRTLGLDPRMLRYSVVKMGSTLEELRSVVGEVQWRADADAVQN
jgi:small subunit ribosomal protein S6